jgi:outer membrane protein assembly factor BamB
MWGYCSSPLVTNGKVIIYGGGQNRLGLFALNSETGQTEWNAPCAEHSYSSAQLCNIAGEDRIAMLSNSGLDLIDPQNGAVDLNYQWQHPGYRSLQTHVLDDSSMLVPTGLGSGTRRIALSNEGGKISAEEEWTSLSLKSDFNDMVVFEDHIYGFDRKIFTCVDAKSGERKWRGGRYGKGQVLLLKDSSALLVMTENGEVALLESSPDGHQELGRFRAFDGKTWNHPVVVQNRLYVRNAEEAACFELATIESAKDLHVEAESTLEHAR